MPQTLPHPKKAPFFRLAWSLPLAVAGALALTGCASTPEPPERALAAAEQAISTAEQARVADYASPELGEARRNLTAARDAVQDEEMVIAERYAIQARADAELAMAKANAAKAREVNEELQASIDALRQEAQRNNGDRP
jgi:hypothetical protein